MARHAEPPESAHVVIVGAGFAGLGCAKELAKHEHVRTTLIDKHNYHQFQPLLYQVATAQLAATDIAFDIRQGFRKHPNVDVKMAEVVSTDPDARSVTMDDGDDAHGRLPGAGGGQPAELLRHAWGRSTRSRSTRSTTPQRLRSRILAVFEDADKRPVADRPRRAELRDRRGRRNRHGDRRGALGDDQRRDAHASTTTWRSSAPRSSWSTTDTPCSRPSRRRPTTTRPRRSSATASSSAWGPR